MKKTSCAPARLCALALAACLCLALFACGKGAGQADYSILEGISIAVSGLPGGEFTVDAARLPYDFAQAEREALSVNSLGEERQRQAKGVLLETILQLHGASQGDYARAEAVSGDGYAIAIPAEVLHGRDILIAYELDGGVIEPRLVVPGERAMYWVKSLRGIELIAGAESVAIEKEVSLADLIAGLLDRAEDYKYGDADCKALPIALLLEAAGAERADFVTITAADGLVKNERWSSFAGQLLVFEGTPEAPLFTGPDLPEGMRVKNVESIQIGGVLLR